MVGESANQETSMKKRSKQNIDWIQRTARRHIPKHMIHCNHNSENLKLYMLQYASQLDWVVSGQ
jgi:hypothetical protein